MYGIRGRKIDVACVDGFSGCRCFCLGHVKGFDDHKSYVKSEALLLLR